MSFPGTGFISRSFIPFGGFVPAFGFESGLGEILIPEEEDLFREGRRDVQIAVGLPGGPKVLMYLESPLYKCDPGSSHVSTTARGPRGNIFVSGAREEEKRGSTRATVRRAPKLFIRKRKN